MAAPAPPPDDAADALPHASGLRDDQDRQLLHFLAHSGFRHRGALVTDLDGTAVHEVEGRVVIPKVVEFGLKQLEELGRPVIVNTLRFPLSVLRTFGSDWARISDAPLPVVCCNGAVSGTILRDGHGRLTFLEADALVLTSTEIEHALAEVERLLAHGAGEVLLFWYPQAWRTGEVIWTPTPARVAEVRARFRSASEVLSGPLPGLRQRLLAEPVNLLFLHVDWEEDRRMAYQHTSPTGFITPGGCDKLAGARRTAARLGVDLAASVGAGDTAMDTFLAGVGLAVHVGTRLPFPGLAGTIQVRNALAFGELLFRLCELHASRQQ